MNLFLFLNKSMNLISLSWIHLPYENVPLIQHKNFLPIYTYLISEGDEIVRAGNRHRNETVTLRKHYTKYKYIRKLMVEFLRKSQNCGIKFAAVNSIRKTKCFNLL